MNWLARLKSEKVPDTRPTEPTKRLQGSHGMDSVGFVGHTPAPSQKIVASEAAANDILTATTGDFERCCWPHSEAMNGQEIDTFTVRQARFTDKGIGLDNAERLADKLVIRDRESDDRRLCLECGHLLGVGRWRCGNWMTADMARDGLAPELVQMLQRCCGFRSALNSPP